LYIYKVTTKYTPTLRLTGLHGSQGKPSTSNRPRTNTSSRV